MKLVDEQIERLLNTRMEKTSREDFDQFWNEVVREAMETPLDIQGGKIDHPFPAVEVRDITFAATDGTRIETWLLLPPEAKEKKVPGVICYHGATGSRAVPASYSHYLLMGCAVIAMDFRMQGGFTGSTTGFEANGNISWMAMGIRDHNEYYFKYVTSDAIRCVKLALETDCIDNSKIAVIGGSQGGAMSLTIAALCSDVSLCLAHVPSWCGIEHRIMNRNGGASSIANYLQRHPEMIDTACKTVSYFDNINFAEKISCPTLIGVGLKDPVCPPEGIYAVYNRITSEKEIAPYPFGEHGGGGSAYQLKELEWLKTRFF